MGICKHCKKEIIMDVGDTKCPNCGEQAYSCWNCHAEIPDNVMECSGCGFYICPECGVCGKECPIIVGYSRNVELHPSLKDEKKKRGYIRAVRMHFDVVKNKTNQRYVCDKHVPISYAKQKIKSLVCRTKGQYVKSDEDRELFNERINELYELPIGDRFRISQRRDAGTYGQEYRDASYYSVCMGVLKIIYVEKPKKKPDSKKEFLEFFERVYADPCPLQNYKNISLKKCKSCDKTFDWEHKLCPNCNEELVYTNNAVQFCQMNRNDFKQKKGLFNGRV